MLTVLSWIAVVCSVSGNYYVNQKRVCGQVLWFVGSLIWLGLSLNSHIWSQVALFSIYTGFNIQGMWKWRKDV